MENTLNYYQSFGSFTILWRISSFEFAILQQFVTDEKYAIHNLTSQCHVYIY